MLVSIEKNNLPLCIFLNMWIHRLDQKFFFVLFGLVLAFCYCWWCGGGSGIGLLTCAYKETLLLEGWTDELQYNILGHPTERHIGISGPQSG